MRALAQPDVVKKASAGAILSCLGCLPALIHWETRPCPIWYLAAILLTTSFVLWAFVFAWHIKLTGRHPLAPANSILHWATATLWAGLNAVIACALFDPKLRVLAPDQFPTSICSWLGTTLVALSLERLVLIFAPVAFFGRLAKNRVAVVVLTALFNGLVAVLKVNQLGLPLEFAWQTILTRLIGSAVAVCFYLRGGVWTILWMSLITHARLLPGLLVQFFSHS